MTQILLELKHIEQTIEDFFMKHLHMGNYKLCIDAKEDLHNTLLAGAISPALAVEDNAEPTVSEPLPEPVVAEVPLVTIPDEQPDAVSVPVI